jgi:FkbM family methyltransferase
VVAVEADRATCGVTKINLSSLANSGGTWRLENRAAGANDTDVLKFCDDGNPMSHRVDVDGKLEVQSISLRTLVDACAGKDGTVDLAKIDIEGAEEAFLCAEPECLQRIKVLAVELHPDYCNAERVRELLSTTYRHITAVQNRTSSKPLFYCRN